VKKAKGIFIIAIVGLAFCTGGYLGSNSTLSESAQASEPVVKIEETEYIVVNGLRRSPREIRFHWIEGVDWFVYWGAGNYTMMQRVELWFEDNFGGDWDITFDAPSEVIIEVPVEIIVEVPVEVVKEIPTRLKFFDSKVALKEWIDDNRLPIIWGIPDYDCDDYSIDLVELAENAGYRLMECPVYRGMVFGSVRVSNPNEARHVGVWTRINDLFYYIEPQTGEIR